MRGTLVSKKDLRKEWRGEEWKKGVHQSALCMGKIKCDNAGSEAELYAKRKGGYSRRGG